MSDSARLARQHFLTKPLEISADNFPCNGSNLVSIVEMLPDAISTSAYSAVISYTEAISGLQRGSSSWAIIQLYYSCFYSIRALLLASGVLPFNCKKEILLDTNNGKYLKGGSSSHNWNWGTINLTPLNGKWFCSQDSQDAYKSLREHRENVNYTHGFTDPNLHHCLIESGLTSKKHDLLRRFRVYRDDDEFFYTYLTDHLAIAYPTRLIFQVESAMKSKSISIPQEKLHHVNSIWTFKDRCPLL